MLGDNANIYVTNTASDYVTVLDNNLNIIEDSIRVGFNPSEIVRFNSNIYVAKQSYTFEKSLAIINTINNQVSRIFFNSPPVCVETGADRVYVSTYSGKKIYSILPSDNSLIDSMVMNITEPAIGTIVLMDSHTLFVLGVTDTSFSSNIGKRIYKVDMQTKVIDPNFNIIYTGNDDAYGIAYHSTEQKLFVANSKNGTVNGEVNVYDKDGNPVITYSDIGGKFPKRIAFINY
jgi:YVTN family beta-propeller protein